MNGNSHTQKNMSGAIAACSIAFALLVLFAIWQVKSTEPISSSTTTHSVEVEHWEAEVKTFEWRIESAKRAFEAAAKAGNTTLADQWDKHIIGLDKQLTDAKIELERAKDKEKGGDGDDSK